MNQNSKGKHIINVNQISMQAMIDWNNMFAAKPEKEIKDEKILNFKKRLEVFKNVSTLEEAKALLMKTIPVSMERTVFFIDTAKCVIINKTNRLRISFNTDKDFISYDFV